MELMILTRITAVALAVGWTFVLWRLLLFQRSVRRYAASEYHAALPSVSVIIPARNEAQSIEACLRSLLFGEDMPLEIIVVDDGSIDGTIDVVERIAREDARVLFMRAGDLPEGWLGKTHACFRGARVARGDYLLFTDADVLYKPEALRKVMRIAAEHHAAHVTMFPVILSGSRAESALMTLFALLYLVRFDPVAAARPGSHRQYAGVGAFNLVRRDVYTRVGGHNTLAMEIVDDVRLGMLVKEAGEGTIVLSGDGFIQVRWRAGFVDTLRAVRRSMFPGMNYRVSRTLFNLFLMTAALLGPPLLLFVPDGTVRIAGGIASALLILIHELLGRTLRTGHATWLLHPVTSIGMIAATFLSMTECLLRGGISWRGRFYPLSRLRRKRGD